MGLNGNGNGSLRLHDKVSIITGGGQGIGRATSVKFAREGAKVAVCDINMTSVAETLAQIRAFGGEALGFQVDVTDKESIARMVESVMFAWQRIDTLINNAGIVQDARLSKMTDDQFERVIDVNLKGVYNCTKAVVDIMLEQHSGCILNASSIVGLYGNFGQTNYANWHQMPLFDPTLLLLCQLAEHLAQVPPQFCVQRSPPTLGDKHQMIFALPLAMA